MHIKKQIKHAAKVICDVVTRPFRATLFDYKHWRDEQKENFATCKIPLLPTIMPPFIGALKAGAYLTIPICFAGIYALGISKSCPHLLMGIPTVPFALTAVYVNAIEPIIFKHQRRGFNPWPLSNPDRPTSKINGPIPYANKYRNMI